MIDRISLAMRSILPGCSSLKYLSTFQMNYTIGQLVPELNNKRFHFVAYEEQNQILCNAPKIILKSGENCVT